MVDINLYFESDFIYFVVDEINILGVFIIGGYGIFIFIEFVMCSIMIVKDLVYLIKFDGNYKDGMIVWLFFCNIGKG